MASSAERIHALLVGGLARGVMPELAAFVRRDDDGVCSRIIESYLDGSAELRATLIKEHSLPEDVVDEAVEQAIARAVAVKILKAIKQ